MVVGTRNKHEVKNSIASIRLQMQTSQDQDAREKKEKGGKFPFDSMNGFQSSKKLICIESREENMQMMPERKSSAVDGKTKFL